MYSLTFFLIFVALFRLHQCKGAIKSVEIPEIHFEIYYPRGFKASISSEYHYTSLPPEKEFTFHGKKNQEFIGLEYGTWSGITNKIQDKHLIYENKDAVFEIGDTLYYWYLIKSDSHGFRQDGQFQIEGYNITKESSTNVNCKKKSVTKVNGVHRCPEEVVFEDNFNFFDEKKWKKERRLDKEPDYGFTMYLTEDKNLYIENGTLRIGAVRSDNYFGQDFEYYDYSIKDCTSNLESECVHKRDNGIILPPSISGRINTYESFRFTYGIVEIRAHVTTENWVYPQMLLEPVQKSTSECESGQMRIAHTRDSDGELYGGVLLGPTGPARWAHLCKSDVHGIWRDGYQTYTLKWTPTEIVVSGNGKEYCRITPGEGFSKELIDDEPLERIGCWNTTMAPFDKEFYLTLGVGVGGINDFPDNKQWYDLKTWRNADVRAMNNFWKRSGSYWLYPHISFLKVDYVRVIAL